MWNLQTTECWFSVCIPSRIGGVMVSMLASIEVDHGLDSRSSQTKYYKIDTCFLPWYSKNICSLKQLSPTHSFRVFRFPPPIKLKTTTCDNIVVIYLERKSKNTKYYYYNVIFPNVGQKVINSTPIKIMRYMVSI